MPENTETAVKRIKINANIRMAALMAALTITGGISVNMTDRQIFSHDGKTYLVVTGEEAIERARVLVRQTVYAVPTVQIMPFTNLPEEASGMLALWQETQKAEANRAILALVTNAKKFETALINERGINAILCPAEFANDIRNAQTETGDTLYIYRIA